MSNEINNSSTSSSNSSNSTSNLNNKIICSFYLKFNNNKRNIGITIRSKLNRISLNDNNIFKFELYDFIDNEKYSNLNYLIFQLNNNGNSNNSNNNDKNNDKNILFLLSDDIIETNDGKLISNILKEQNIEIIICKKNNYRINGYNDMIDKLLSVQTYTTNSVEIERPLGLISLMAIYNHFQLSHDEQSLGHCILNFGSLNKYMRLDSSAANAINLFPKADDPSPYASLYGLLNRCKTKMGQRLLESWLRNPLIDCEEINHRLDIVELLKNSIIGRNHLIDGGLKGIADIDNYLIKIQKPNCDLETIYRLYVFTKSLSKIAGAIEDLTAENPSDSKTLYLIEKYLRPIHDLDSKFDLYRELIEHVIDIDRLPEVVISAKHDSELSELEDERISIENSARKLQEQANSSWGSFTDVKLEHNQQWGFIFRTTKGDDEREIRSNNPKVRILSLQKNGLHFTTPQLSDLADRYREIELQYKKQQTELVKNAVLTAKTYLPILEAASTLVAELDVLSSFATISALSPEVYTRPTLIPLATSIENIQERSTILIEARHPCVELMDMVNFIPNDYKLETGISNFQIITGPNMGGKSTFIRGIGCITCLAQVGCFVPAKTAQIAIVDCILARVGAGDAGQKGISTFMAEMLEASVLLETASYNSLIIIDELGRGTSTFDGFGIAWAIAEYISSKINCFCLFATHFHELTSLSKHKDNIKNIHVSALVQDKEVIMLHQILNGPCLESFGIPVASMAGFPENVINEAKRKSNSLEDPEAFGITTDSIKLQRIENVINKFSTLDFPKKYSNETEHILDELKKDVNNIMNE